MFNWAFLALNSTVHQLRLNLVLCSTIWRVKVRFFHLFGFPKPQKICSHELWSLSLKYHLRDQRYPIWVAMIFHFSQTRISSWTTLKQIECNECFEMVDFWANKQQSINFGSKAAEVGTICTKSHSEYRTELVHCSQLSQRQTSEHHL